MKRREVFQVMAGTAVAHSLVTVLGCGAQTPAASAHDHPGGAPTGAAPGGGSPVSEAHEKVAKLAADCLVVGETCLEHCVRSLSSGSTMMAECAAEVQQMLAVCRAMASLAAMGSSYAKKLAPLSGDACSACAAACGKHAGHHAECAACEAACRAVVAALPSLV